ncbi:MAG: B12-binding domain-containing radical SAM protein [Elusimicrobiales bacterium]|nr:B12-binding domain-containing radical SAM protein [Elusimicrobiales bacterium]
MKIAFITSHYDNLGIEYLSAYLKKNGYDDIKLYFEPSLFYNFFYKNNFLYNNFFNFKEKIIKDIEKDLPDIVAFSVISDNYSWTLDMATRIKGINNDIKIVFGGIHPSSVPEYVLNDRVADYIIIGEGEEAFLELIAAVENHSDLEKIDNLGGYKKNGDIFINKPRNLVKDLDTLPFPDKSLFYNECSMMIEKSYTITGSRGCQFKCSYCWNSSIKKIYSEGFFRRRSINNIIEELKEAKEKFNIKRVTFYDEVFTASKSWLKDFCKKYKEEISLPYFCCVHPYHIDEETVSILEDSGCSSINLGIQTTSPSLASIINRRQDIESIKKALHLLHHSKIYVYSNFMLGLPDQTIEDVENDFLFSVKNRSDMPAIYWLRYYPNTEIIAIAQEKKILLNEQIEDINKAKKYLPYAISGNTFRKDFSRLANLIVVSKFIPEKIAEKIINKKLYRFLPSKNLFFPLMATAGYISAIFEGKKNVFHYFSLFDYIKFYLIYIIKCIKYKIRNFIDELI